jgi:hypothetical protein
MQTGRLALSSRQQPLQICHEALKPGMYRKKTFMLMGWRCDDKGDLGLAEQGVDSQPQL